MKINGKDYRSIWPSDVKDARGHSKWVEIINQQLLPQEFKVKQIMDGNDMGRSILDLEVCGAGLIGSSAAWGLYLDTWNAPPVLSAERLQEYLIQKGEHLTSQRPTAVNLQWAVDRMLDAMRDGWSLEAKTEIAWRVANDIWNEDAQMCDDIGKHTVPIIEELHEQKKEMGLDGRVNIMTICNAGALAFVDGGTATAGIYQAHEKGIPLHVWVNRTPPKYQGSKMTAFELGSADVPYTIIPNTAAGHVMQQGEVDMVIVGTDRTLHTGYVCNKIGTYMLALAAKDNLVPFFVGLPDSTFDWDLKDPSEIKIEQRNGDEVRYVEGWMEKGPRRVSFSRGSDVAMGYAEKQRVLITPKDAQVANYAFDVTPPCLITGGLITPHGLVPANEKMIRALYNKPKE